MDPNGSYLYPQHEVGVQEPACPIPRKWGDMFFSGSSRSFTISLSSKVFKKACDSPILSKDAFPLQLDTLPCTAPYKGFYHNLDDASVHRTPRQHW